MISASNAAVKQPISKAANATPVNIREYIFGPHL